MIAGESPRGSNRRSDPRAPGHECILFYRSAHTAADAAELDGLAAVRCGEHKVYWYVDAGSSTPLPAGYNATGKLSFEAPMVFDLSTDWSEEAPLAHGSPRWAAAKAKAEAARSAHLASLSFVQNQLDRGSSHEYAICADPHSQKRHPHMPNCTISPQNWAPPVCLEGGASGRGQIDECIGQTRCDDSCRFVRCGA